MVSIIKGNSYAYSVTRTLDGSLVDLTDYTLQIKVVDSSGADTAISRTVTTQNNDNTAFLINLTAAETDTLLDNQRYKLCNRLENIAESYVRDIEEVIAIKPSCFD